MGANWYVKEQKLILKKWDTAKITIAESIIQPTILNWPYCRLWLSENSVVGPTPPRSIQRVQPPGKEKQTIEIKTKHEKKKRGEQKAEQKNVLVGPHFSSSAPSPVSPCLRRNLWWPRTIAFLRPRTATIKKILPNSQNCSPIQILAAPPSVAKPWCPLPAFSRSSPVDREESKEDLENKAVLLVHFSLYVYLNYHKTITKSTVLLSN